MRLYIPTSSLNADSILACESIAPAYECRKRKFGYQYFDVLPELRNFDKVTLAFSRIPIFYTNDLETEKFALLISVDIEDLDKRGFMHLRCHDGVDIYATAAPIHISPATTQLLFFDKQSLEYTLHSCADSAKCKLFDFYKSSFAVADSSSFGARLYEYVEKIDIISAEPLYSENKFDKIKGFIWGYGMGTMMSITPEAAKLLKIQKRIYDIVSSTKNENDVPSSLSDEIVRLDNEFTSIDPNQIAIIKDWGAYIKEIADTHLHANLVVSDIETFLKEIGAEAVVKSKFLIDRRYTVRKKLSEYKRVFSYNYELYSRDIANYTELFVNRIRMKVDLGAMSSKLDVDTNSFETVMMAGFDRNSMLFNKILSRIIWNGLIPSVEELRVNKAGIAKSVVIEIKDVIENLGEQWVNTPVQMYFNAMRKNISDFTVFDLNGIKDPVLQSIAAFILKGEDFESLKSYLEINAFANYRYAFALWGAVNGYVSIPRSVIESNFSSKEIARIYTQTQKSLGIEGNINILNNDEPIDIKSKSTQASTTSNVSFRHSVISFFDSLKKTKNTDLLRKGLIETLDKLEYTGYLGDGYILVTTLDNKPGWDRKPAAWKHLQEKFCPDYDAQRGGIFGSRGRCQIPMNSKEKKGIKSFFRELFVLEEESASKKVEKTFIRPTPSILSPGNLLGIINSHFPSLPKQIATDVNWFVGNFADVYYDDRKKEAIPGKYAQSARDNATVLEKFTNYLHNKQDSSQRWLRDIYREIPVEDILRLLNSIYGK